MIIPTRHKAHAKDTKFRLYRLGGTLGLSGVLFSAGCGGDNLLNANNNIQGNVPKLAQCNQLADIVNQTQGFMQEFEGSIQVLGNSTSRMSDVKLAARENTASFDKAVTNLGSLVTDLQASTLQDTTLSQFRDSYIEVIQGFISALTDAGKAMDLVNEVKAESELSSKIQESQQETITAVTAIKDLSQTESQLINEVNAYCGGETSTQGSSETTKENLDSSTEDYPGQTENIEEFGRERYEELSKCQDELIAKGATAEEIVETCDFSEEEEITPLSQEEAEELLCSEAKNDPSNPWYSDCLQKGF